MALTVQLSDSSRSYLPQPKIPDHELLRCIGSGSYGEVWLARNVMGTYRAVKVVYRGSFSEERPYEREFHGMEKFEPVSRSHDGFVDILQVGRNDRDGYFYCVMELADDAQSGQAIDPKVYCPKTLGGMFAKAGRVSFPEAVEIGASLAAALSHLHESGLIHRDIKPSNIIFINGIPKIADIGLVTEMGESRSYVGTEGFMPPEGPGTVQGDIYSLGKVLYEISTGRDRKAFPELPTNVSEMGAGQDFIELNEVILRACEQDVQKRYQTAEQMHKDLLMLQAGKSVKRLRVLERRMALLKKVAIVSSILFVLGAGGIYEINREIKLIAERRQQQVGRNVAYGTRFMDEGDYFGSLPPFVEALSLDYSDPLRQETHRLRIASVLAQCPKIQQLWFLNSQINCAQISRDGRYVLIASPDGTATLCDLESDREPASFIKHEKELEGVAFSGDGQFVITTASNQADVWEFATRKRIQTLNVPTTVYNAQFSPDRKMIATASGNASEGQVWLWDFETGNYIAELATAKGAFRIANFSPDSSRIVTAGENGIAEIWDLKTRNRVGAPIRHGSWVYWASFSPDGKWVATADYDGTVLVSDVETGRLVLPPLKHPAGVKNVEFSPDGRYVVTACWDFTARVWRMSDGQAVHPFLKHSGKHVISASFTPDGRHIVTANGNGVLSLWDLAPIGFFPGTNNYQFSRGGNAYAMVQTNRVEIWSAETKTLVSRVQAPAAIEQIKLTHEGTWLMLLLANESETGDGRKVQVFQSNGESMGKVIPFDTGAVLSSISNDGEYFVGLKGKAVEIWSSREGRLLHSLAHPQEVKTNWLSGDGSLILTSTGSTNAYLWRTSSGTLLRILSSEYPISHAEFSPNGERLVVCSDDGTLFERSAQVWEVKSGQKVGPALEHSDGVKFATFSPDGKKVLTASDDSTARLWEVETGKPLLILTHPHNVTEAAFSPDGRWIATACRLRRFARVWDAETGEPITPPLRHPFPFSQVQFVRGGKELVTRTADGVSTLWEFPLDEHPIEHLAALAQLLSGHQSDYTGGILPQRTEALRETWERLRAAKATDFQASRKAILSWHQREAEASEKEMNWAAAGFHWKRLTELEPENILYVSRLGETERKNALDKRGTRSE